MFKFLYHLLAPKKKLTQTDVLKALNRENERGPCEALSSLRAQSRLKGRDRNPLDGNPEDIYKDIVAEEHRRRNDPKDIKPAASPFVATDKPYENHEAHSKEELGKSLLSNPSNTIAVIDKSYGKGNRYHQVCVERINEDEFDIFDSNMQGGLKHVESREDMLEEVMKKTRPHSPIFFSQDTGEEALGEESAISFTS